MVFKSLPTLKLAFLLLTVFAFACSPNASEEVVAPRSLAVSSSAVYDSLYYMNHPMGITIDYKRIADTTFTDPVTQEVVHGISYKVLVYDSVAIKAPWEGGFRLVSFRRPTGKPALNLSSKNASDNVYFVRKDEPKSIYSHFFYYNRIPAGTYQPMVCRFVVGKYANDPDMRYANIANWDKTTIIIPLKSNGIFKFFITNPWAGLDIAKK
ncbi:MAG: hypothetical protein M3142_15860 [Bacteroidota bacterium]|nr:hypothetical protein [Bacteroidota bacterium]